MTYAAEKQTSMIVRGPGRPGIYYTSDGTRVPSVTTITGARKSNVEGLLIWANELGKQGLGHRDVRQQAADAGSRAHAMVENAIHNRNIFDGLAECDEATALQARTGYEAWFNWSKVMKVEYIETETPMISEKHRYGGTPDAVGMVDGKLALMDWKSGGGIYGDYLIQAAAYDQLWNELHPERPLKAWYILRFGKIHGDFHLHSYPLEVIERAWQGFLHLREMYQIDKELKKVCT